MRSAAPEGEAQAAAPLRASLSQHKLRTTHTTWRPSHRLVPSRFPPVGLFDRVADPADLEAVFALEALTNDRLREEVGDLSLVAPGERVSGPGSTAIMAAFTHLNPEGSRFSDGSFGVYYCARTLAAALAEVRHHREEFLRRTNEGPLRLELRLYLADLDARLVDVRRHPEYHRPDDYAPSQALGSELRAGGADGVLYRSVRCRGELCAAVFRPVLLKRCRQSKHYAFHYDGRKIVAIDELSTVWTAAR